MHYQCPVRDAGPAFVSSHRSCQKPNGEQSTGAPSFRSCHSFPAIRAMPALLSRSALTGPTFTPIPLIDCRRLSTRPTPWHDLSR